MKLLRMLVATPFLLAATFAYADGNASEAPPVSTAAASDAVAPAPAPAAVASIDKDAKVCRMERTIGSNMAKRICRTKAQVEAETEAARKTMSGPTDRGN